MPTPNVRRVFVPAAMLQSGSEGLDAASADESFGVVGVPGRHELAGFLVPLQELEQRGVPGGIACQVAMFVGLSSSEHAILLSHSEELWELLMQNGKGLPETYTFRSSTSAIPSHVIDSPRVRIYPDTEGDRAKA